ncbi:hypothetical protein GCM10022199_25220 [Marihabitans asiaticum]|uniref:DNA-binding NarL/FixJ family response regulator n=2 Tax=Marihabitans asiaticum TaxID=415218 RepID=A0A560W9H2_9MICO|nr:DNA-binding NarL/FixJ family response regulator [Marihabitans asiaticum]
MALVSRSIVMRLGMRAVLEASGARVVAEVGSARGVAELPPGSVDVVLADRESLQRWDGEVLGALTQLPSRPAVVVLGHDPRAAADASGIVSVRRECEPEELMSVVRRQLDPADRSPECAEPGPVRDRKHEDSEHRLGLLTARELEVLSLLARGMSNAEIAQRMAIAENTVKNHVRGVLSKLELPTRLAAATFALRRWSPEPPSTAGEQAP